MSALRSEIRAILREELAALQTELPVAPQSTVEAVQLHSSADLNSFVRELLLRASEPDFVDSINTGQHQFALAPGVTHDQGARRSLVSTVTQRVPTINKALITERDIASIDQATRQLCLDKHSRLTPLARDEARRKGIRIHRIDS